MVSGSQGNSPISPIRPCPLGLWIFAYFFFCVSMPSPLVLELSLSGKLLHSLVNSYVVISFQNFLNPTRQRYASLICAATVPVFRGD